MHTHTWILDTPAGPDGPQPQTLGCKESPPLSSSSNDAADADAAAVAAATHTARRYGQRPDWSVRRS